MNPMQEQVNFGFLAYFSLQIQNRRLIIFIKNDSRYRLFEEAHTNFEYFVGNIAVVLNFCREFMIVLF